MMMTRQCVVLLLEHLGIVNFTKNVARAAFGAASSILMKKHVLFYSLESHQNNQKQKTEIDSTILKTDAPMDGPWRSVEVRGGPWRFFGGFAHVRDFVLKMVLLTLVKFAT